MTDFTKEPAFKSILQSEQWAKLPPEKRKALYAALGEMTTGEREQLASNVVPAQVNMDPDVWAPQEGYQTAYSPEKPRTMAEQGKTLAPMVIDMIGQAGGAMLAAPIGAPVAGEVAGAYLANQANKALGFREGKPFGSPTLDDILSGTPAVVRTGTQLAKDVTRPAQKAIKRVDKQVGEFDTAVKTHQEALDTVPGEAKKNIQVGDFKADYATSKAAAVTANPVDLPEFNATAQQLGVQLQSPADPLQPRKYVNLTEALGEWSDKPQSLQRSLDTVQKLGQVISKLRRSGGEELGAAKQLYASLWDDLDKAALTDPQAKAAIDAFRAGQAGFRKQMAMDDYLELFKVKKGYTNVPGAGKEVKTQSILDNFENLRDNDRFFRGSFTPQELGFLEANLQKLPTKGIPANPNRTPDVGEFPFGKVIMGKVVGSTVGGVLGERLGFGTYPGIVVGGLIGGGSVAVPYWVSKTILAHPQGETIIRGIMQSTGPDIKKLAALTTAARAMGGTPDDEEVK